ncbi:type IV pilus secretin PilQ [Acinetobacter sp. MD2(2019)]|uniref:type IV pilus secretin PilQ n=1 Tax=Acinetobacter sp. MD2(2019) TaxID=2605273 RepID=UPI002D1F5528|nr:type IV pilus secretin PilQ [Acinetobacter sp. MD2(2019)]MEB3753209.1 type IV pilus secretin PilQ [Acinetobacter sp. MD2(2019)]
MKDSVEKLGFGKSIMSPFIRQFALTTMAMAVFQVAHADVAITNIIPLQVPGQGTEIRVMFNGLPPQPQAYQLEQPSRLVLDFNKATQNLKQSTIPVATAEAKSVDLSSDATRSRLTVNLANAGAFTTRIEGNTFILKVNSATSTSANQATKVAAQAQQGINKIDFQRGNKGEGQVVVNLNDPNMPVDVKQQGNKILVRFLGNKIPANLIKRLNVNDFATPVSSVEAYNDGRNGVISVNANGSFDYMAYQAEKSLTISVAKKEETTANNAAHAARAYTGKKISLDFQDIEVRRVLQLLADFTGMNIVASDTVQGNITLRLKDVPWDQALDIIMKTKGLDKRKNGNVIWVAPVTELLKSEEDEAKAYSQSVKLAPLQTETMQLNYVKAADVKKMIDDAASKASNGSNNTSDEGMRSLMSSRGSIVIDNRTNTVIINDTAAKIEQLKGIISQIDLPVKQVMIEARIVRTQIDLSHELGVKWGLTKPTNASSWDQGKYTSSGSLGVDLGASTSYGTLSLGLLRLGSSILDLQLAASQSDGKSEVLSTPKVMTGDKQEALIRSGMKIPYSSSSANTGTTTTFQEAVLELKVVPSITPDNKVQMKLDISKDTLGSELTDAGYAINVNKLQTNVLVADGETIVLGGLYEDEVTNSVKKVPVLGDIPVLGNLFKNSQRSDSKRELLIFITPRIIDDTVSRNH